MTFCFYPKHEYACPQVSHCPHLGGAALATLVQAAGESQEGFDWLNRRLDAARKSVSELVAENEALKQQIERLKLELKLERQTKFATNRQRQAEPGLQAQPCDPSSPAGPRKRALRWGIPAGFVPRRTTTTRWSRCRRPSVARTAGGRSRCLDRSRRSITIKKT